jgi:hypothetical protein
MLKNKNPAEISRGLVWQENFESAANIALNGGVITGALEFRDKGAYFDGTNDYVTYSLTTGKLQSATPLFTVMAWIKTPVISTTRRQICSSFVQVLNEPGIIVELTAITGLFSFVAIDNGTTKFKTRPSTVRVDDNKWHHVIATFNGTDINLYVDGLLSNGTQTNVGAPTTYTQTSPMTIGKSLGALGSNFVGYIKDLKSPPKKPATTTQIKLSTTWNVPQ